MRVKKKILLIVLFSCVSLLRLSAQSDSFFNYQNLGDMRAIDHSMQGEVEIGRLDVEYVPLGGGMFVMLTCSVMYAAIKKGR